ncbi:YesL family protein [Vagococcus fluvialis]
MKEGIKMLGTGLEKGFKTIWLIMKLNLFFHLFSLMGGYILGIGPSIQMVSDLFQESKFDYKEITFKRAFELWKSHFIRSNGQFLLFFGVFALLAYNLYISVQLVGLTWLIIDFILISAILFIYVAYQYVISYETNYEMPFLQVIKLACISVFFGFGTFWKLLLGAVVIIAVTWQMKGLILFATISLLIIWSVIATKKIRDVVNEKLGFSEEEMV